MSQWGSKADNVLVAGMGGKLTLDFRPSDCSTDHPPGFSDAGKFKKVADAREQELHSDADKQESEDPGHRINAALAQKSNHRAGCAKDQKAKEKGCNHPRHHTHV